MSSARTSASQAAKIFPAISNPKNKVTLLVTQPINNMKSNLAFIGAALLGVCAFLSDIPGNIISQIVANAPQKDQWIVTTVIGLAAYAVHHYGAANRVGASSTIQSGILRVLLFIVLPCFLFSSCALSPAQQTKVNSVITGINNFAQDVEPIVEPLVEDYASDGQITTAQAIPAALEALKVADSTALVDVNALSTQIQNGIAAATNGHGKTTGQKIAQVIVSQLPPNPTGAQVNSALDGASSGATTAVNTIAAKSSMRENPSPFQFAGL